MENLIENKIYYANAYLRLSKEDGDKAESDSISNQRDLIHSFLTENPDIALCDERIDDGFSGASFDRPAFQTMLADINTKKINCVIVKDLSRFGRNFIEVGRFIDQIFPHLGVRFIAINDGFDSANGRTSSDNILLPFKNLINDAFCRDISIKVRSQLEIKRKKGEFIGAFATYGYLKSPIDRHKLLVDPVAADIVRSIYKWKLEGASGQRIAERLNGQGVLSPMEYKHSCGSAYQTSFQVKPKTKWTATAVQRVLTNEIYIGTLVQGKRTTPNHKVKKTVYRPSEDWVRVENNHDAVVTPDEFSTVAQLLKKDTRVAPNMQTVYVFSGLIFCGDCHQNMVKSSVAKKQAQPKTYRYFMCGSNRTEKICTSHRIPEQLVSDSVLASLKQHISNILQVEEILGHIDALPYEQLEAQRVEEQRVKRQEEIDRYAQLKVALYESMVSGLIEKSEYFELKEIYNTKKQGVQAALLELDNDMDSLLDSSNKDTVWMEKFKLCHNITEIDRRIAVTLIDKIYIYEDNRIDIRFQYQYNYERALALIQAANRLQPIDTTLLAKEAV